MVERPGQRQSISAASCRGRTGRVWGLDRPGGPTAEAFVCCYAHDVASSKWWTRRRWAPRHRKKSTGEDGCRLDEGNADPALLLATPDWSPRTGRNDETHLGKEEYCCGEVKSCRRRSRRSLKRRSSACLSQYVIFKVRSVFDNHRLVKKACAKVSAMGHCLAGRWREDAKRSVGRA